MKTFNYVLLVAACMMVVAWVIVIIVNGFRWEYAFSVMAMLLLVVSYLLNIKNLSKEKKQHDRIE